MEFIYPTWPVPNKIRAVATTRLGGVSLAPFDSLNLGLFSGDQAAAVEINRQHLKMALNLPQEPCWLKQIHSARVIDAPFSGLPEADGAYTTQPEIPCVALMADCLPILLCNDQGTEIAAIHGSRKSLFQDILLSALQKFHSPPNRLLAWLGPAICKKHYVLPLNMIEAFRTQFPSLEWDQIASPATPVPNDSSTPLSEPLYHFDLAGFAEQSLRVQGVMHIYSSHLCTYCDPKRFYSHRRDHKTGRMASLIWIEP